MYFFELWIVWNDLDEFLNCGWGQLIPTIIIMLIKYVGWWEERKESWDRRGGIEIKSLSGLNGENEILQCKK